MRYERQKIEKIGKFLGEDTVYYKVTFEIRGNRRIGQVYRIFQIKRNFHSDLGNGKLLNRKTNKDSDGEKA